jgi:hypothetical protein
MLVLLAAPKAPSYYPNIGFSRHESVWILRADGPLPRFERFLTLLADLSLRYNAANA